MLQITRKELLALRPCNAESRAALFVDDATPLTMQEALDKGVLIPDLLWVAARLGRVDLCVRFALACASRVAYLNTDPCVQAALDATQAWLDNPCQETADAAARAAYVARAATRAATRAAARAARAAARAAYAAYAADAADAAAYAAAYAAAETAEQPKIFVSIFCN